MFTKHLTTAAMAAMVAAAFTSTACAPAEARPTHIDPRPSCAAAKAPCRPVCPAQLQRHCPQNDTGLATRSGRPATRLVVLDGITPRLTPLQLVANPPAPTQA